MSEVHNDAFSVSKEQDGAIRTVTCECKALGGPARPDGQQWIKCSYVSKLVEPPRLHAEERANVVRAVIPAGEGQPFVAAAGPRTPGHGQLPGFGQWRGVGRQDNQPDTIGLLVVLERISSAL